MVLSIYSGYYLKKVVELCLSNLLVIGQGGQDLLDISKHGCCHNCYSYIFWEDAPLLKIVYKPISGR